MPTYTFLNKESGIEYDENVPMAEYDEYLKNNPLLERVWHGKAPAMVGDHIDGVHNDGGHNDVSHNDGSHDIGSHKS